MRLELVIKQPDSLDAAKEEFMAWASRSGYIVDRIDVYAQPSLFEEKPDAMIYATVRRKKNANISSPRQADGEPAVGVHL